MKYTLSVLVENQPGVLSRVSGLFSRRGFNIDSLSVGVTDEPRISRMTIVVDGDEHILEQVEKQLNKVIPVIKVKSLGETGAFWDSELLLVKAGCEPGQRGELLSLAELMRARVVDVSPSTVTFQLADRPEQVETLIRLLAPYGIREIVRTGVAAIEKGEGALKK